MIPQKLAVEAHLAHCGGTGTARPTRIEADIIEEALAGEIDQ